MAIVRVKPTAWHAAGLLLAANASMAYAFGGADPVFGYFNSEVAANVVERIAAPIERRFYMLDDKLTPSASLMLSGARLIHALSNSSLHAVHEDDASPPPSSRLGAKAHVAIRVSNDADVFDVTCDGRLAVVGGANSATPVSLVDLDAGREIAKATYAGKLVRFVSIGDDGRSVLVVLDNATNNDGNAVRRLTITATGELADSGDELAFGAEFVSKVRIAPGSKVGVALVGFGTSSRLVAFALAGLAVRGTVTLAHGIPSGLAIAPAGDRVYARSGRRGIVPDVIQGFTLDATTGALGQSAAPSIANVSGFYGTTFQDSMLFSADGTRLIAAEEIPLGPPLLARVTLFDPITGAILDTRPTGDTQVRVIGTERVCKAASATQTLVEYHHAGFDHYFVTALANEIALLDNGTLAGWMRTGDRFAAYAPGTPGTVVTCRFFGNAFGARSSHFYTPHAPECATVKTNPLWQFEGEVFNVALPEANGTCASPNVPLYRVYNAGAGGAPNHRYTTRLDVRAQMIAQGWTAEGLGIGVIACVPPAS